MNFDGFGTYITYLITFMVGAYIGLYKIKLSHQTTYIWVIFSYLITLAWSIAVVKLVLVQGIGMILGITISLNFHNGIKYFLYVLKS